VTARDNEAESKRWNDEFWTSVWPRREQLTSVVTPMLLERAALAPADHVVDIGSGGGTATVAAAAAVGPAGTVTGADISVALVGLASQRAEEASTANVRFLVVDAQSARIEGAPFDAAISQFGVMFFDEPVTAFTNIRGHVRPGGRLTFACWQGLASNPWAVGPALAAILPPPPPPPPGKSPTGPFALADADRTVELLTAAGWTDVSRTIHAVTATVARDAIIDDAQLSFLGVPADRVAEARAAVEAHLAPLHRADGNYDAPLAFQIFTATA
jgi:SAM-dependent methyltransferase